MLRLLEKDQQLKIFNLLQKNIINYSQDLSLRLIQIRCLAALCQTQPELYKQIYNLISIIQE